LISNPKNPVRMSILAWTTYIFLINWCVLWYRYNNKMPFWHLASSHPVSLFRWTNPRHLPLWVDTGPSGAEESFGGPRGALQAAWLWGAAPHRHNHSPQKPGAPPEVPPLLPSPIPTATAAQLRHLRHPPGEMHMCSHTHFQKVNF
jgi:hypothetical protein